MNCFQKLNKPIDYKNKFNLCDKLPLKRCKPNGIQFSKIMCHIDNTYSIPPPIGQIESATPDDKKYPPQ